MRRGKGITIYFYLFMLVIFLPLLLLLVFSFNDSFSAGFPWRGFTLRWWETFFADPVALTTVKNSFVVAVTVAVVATLMGLGVAFPLVRRVFRGQNVLLSALLVPIAVPYLLIGISLFSLLRVELGLELSLFTLAIGHILVALPYSSLVLMARLIGFDRSLEEAAQDLGATGFTTFRKITFPLIKPGIYVSMFLTFTVSLEDAVIATFLGGSDQTVPMFVFGRLRRWEGLPMAMALSSFMVLIALVFACLFLIRAVRPRLPAPPPRGRG
ncbi:MAG: ABC transporter permease subunit [Candidatus Bathyarchaeota archaeon]|nr:MAG: ABC transporter permease subunit [Candidatus Bathyarchaeota archaeon]